MKWGREEDGERDWEGWGEGRTQAFVCQFNSHAEVGQGFRAGALGRQQAWTQTEEGFLSA